MLFLCLAKEIKKWIGEEGIRVKQCVECTVYVTKNRQYLVHILQLVQCNNFFQYVVFMLSKGDLVYILFTLETTPHCDDKHLPPVSQWKCHNSNGEHKWTGEEGIRVKQCGECTV